GDPARPARGDAGGLRLPVRDADRRGHRDPDGDRRGLVPADRSGVSERRRRLHREQGEPRDHPGPDRGRGPAHRLRAHGRGVDRGGGLRPDVGRDEPAPYKVELSIGFVIFITLANLRGVRESGTLFAFPTYAFIVSILTMVAIGLARCVGGCPLAEPVPPAADLAKVAGPVGLFIVLRAFSSGSTALTGVEAISNGVPAFRRPQARNAAETLAMMGAIAITMFLGISFLASRMHVTVSDERSVVAQVAHATFGGGIGFYLVQIFTTMIL